MTGPASESAGIDPHRAARVASQMLSQGTYSDVSGIFRALGDATRVRILDAISREELCVCDISFVLGMKPSAVSHHLRTLRNLQLVRHRRAGKRVYYALRDSHVAVLLSQALDHVRYK